MLCWVDLAHGLMFSDLFEEGPRLRYPPLPGDHFFDRSSCRNVCVTAGGMLKFVNIFPRCCCGGADGIVDCTKIWALDGYECIPRVQLDYPVVSMDEPHAISFEVCEEHDGNKAVWLVMVDMMSKALLSVFRYPEGRRRSILRQHMIPSRVSEYFCGNPDSAQAEYVPNFTSRSQNEIELQIDGIKKLSVAPMEASKAASSVAKILAALEEIPGLARDDMLRAYRILSHDNSGRRLRTILALPMDLMKDYVMLEIKASEACFVCSACTAELQLDG
ncbi:hypothetical protein ACP70R_008862 [Stipagrostis hirtigluma subsp. patula]